MAIRCILLATLSYCVAMFISGGVVCAQERPNFVIINIDDLGYADTGAFGSEFNRTPNIDRIAEQGCKLTSFYAAPVCSVSRAALMTGCYPKRALPMGGVFFPGNATGLSPDEITIAELLKEQGYATACIGKWHLGDQPEFLPTRQGFDYYYGLPYSNDMGPAADGVKSNLGAELPAEDRWNQPPLPLMRNEEVLQRVFAEDQTRLVERYTEEAVGFLKEHNDESFFLYMPHSAVHFPIYPGKAFQGKSNNGIYGDWVEEVDWSVGQVLSTLEELGLKQNTLVLFVSDNGGTRRGINEPLRGFKASVWEGGVRVPAIAMWPDNIPAGTASDEVTGMMDIMPTFVKLAGGEVPNDRKIDGGDIWPLLSGEPNAKTAHDVIYFYRGLNLRALRSGDWKYHLQRGQLYNLADDIGETTNLARLAPEVVARMIELANAMRDDLGLQDIGPGCRSLGRVENARPLIDFDK